MTALLVVAGALVGAPLRLWATRTAVRAGRDASAGTLSVNVAGAAVLGAVSGGAGMPPEVLALVGTGFCGALTTFSTMQVELLDMLDAGHASLALAYAAASITVGVAAIWLVTNVVRAR